MKFCMILANNNRSKAYLQNLIKEGCYPEEVIYLDKPGTILSEQTENDSSLYQDTKQKLIKTCSVSGISFDEKESVLSTLQKHIFQIHMEISMKLHQECYLWKWHHM